MTFFRTLILLCAPLGLFAQFDITRGTWYNENRTGRLQFFIKEAKLYAKIVWVEDNARKDERNPDPKLRQRPLIGLVNLTGFTPADARNWSGGKIYDPESGKTYSSKIKVLSDRELEVRGYIGSPVLGKSTRFTKAD
ncbi:DUF2147 domain-containing protein [Ravibacter arvi]|uniref:DUF2147 domain-containing protein n=1 Tax=Ravibacter arvi TaxID=2051041 RepID=A0ABP8LZG1_9BACT